MTSIDDNSDILGGQLRIQPVWATFGFWVKLAVTLALGIVCCVVFLYIRAQYLSWKEERHRLSLRRKYGIPDNDHRPFNVAWAAVQRAQRDKNIATQAEKRPQISQPTSAQQLRHRPPVSANQDNQRNASIPTWAPGATNTHLFPRDLIFTTQTHVYPSSSRASSHRPSSIGPSHDQPSIPPNAYDSSTLDDTSATSRRGSPLRSKRGAKRILYEEDEEELVLRQKAREKRARNISLESAQPIEIDYDEMDDEAMGSSEDDVAELPDIRRGKKRDRAEAGSTFGGDESTGEEEAKEKSARQRKRRTVHGRRKSEIHPRGTKRDRDAEIESESEEEDTHVKNTRKKRGKPSKTTDGSDSSDVSMEDVEYSTDVLCGGRRIGEEWELNGAHFKVGPNGDRLRQALIKKARSRYSMPKDSVHPDSQANVEVFVEVWLTEDQYQDAKARQALAWQDSAPPSPVEAALDIKNSSSVPTHKGGKNLIWSAKPSSRSSTTLSRVPSSDSTLSSTTRRSFRQSLTGNVGAFQPRVNPFHQAPETPSRRISSVGLADSTNNTPESNPSPVRLVGGKSYSKWEKQELEAATMKKIRSRLEEAKNKEAVATPPTITSAPVLASTITFPKPVEKPAEKEVQSKPTATAPVPVTTPKPTSFPAFTLPAAPVITSNTSPAPPAAPAAAPSAPLTYFGNAPVPTAPAAEKSKPSFGLGIPSSKPTTQTPQPAAGGFSFTKPAETTAPQATSAQPEPARTSAPMFAFSAPPQAEKKLEPAQPSNSLLSRLGTQVPESASSPASTQTTSAFSFPKPAVTSNAAPPLASDAPASGNTTATPKFNFGISAAPKTDSTSSQQASSGSSAHGVFGAPAQTTATGGSGMKFNFGAPANPAASAPTQDAKISTPSSSAPTFGNTAVFGASGATPTPSFSFGNSSKPAGASGSSKSPFSFNPAPASSTETSKTAFSFSSAPAASSANPNEASKPTFSFGAPVQPAASSANATSKPAFAFGATPTPGAASATTSAFGSSPFGAPASGAPSPFGATNTTQSAFGNTTGGPTPFSFGNPSTGSTLAFGSTGQKQESK